MGAIPSMRHDAFLRRDVGENQVMVVEAKGSKFRAAAADNNKNNNNNNNNDKNRMTDPQKMGVILAKNLCVLSEKAPPNRGHELRLHGMLLAGTSINFVEARLFDGMALVYSIGNYDIPESISEMTTLTLLLAAIVRFRRRVLQNLRLLQGPGMQLDEDTGI